MPRQKRAKIESSQPEEADQPQSRQKVVEVKHKTEWSELRPVDEASEEIEPESFDDEVIEEKPKRRVNNERDELRKKLAKNNVTPGSELKLTIEKHLHSDVIDGKGGMFADTEHCTKYVCNEAHITSEDYLDVARKYGAGLYRFTLRLKNQIVTAWDKRISAGGTASVIQHVNPADPNSPQVIVQMPEGSQQTVTPIDPFKEAERALSLVEKYNRAFGRFQPQATENLARSEEEIIAGAIIKQPAVIESVVESIIKRVGGKSGGNDEPWYADTVKEAVRSGQGAQIARSIIDALFNGFKGLFPGGQNNGQTQVAQTPIQNQTPQGANQQQRSEFVSGSQGALQQGASPMGSPQALEGGTSGNVEGDVLGSDEPQMATTPEERALRTLIDNCMRKVPPQVAFGRLIAYADAVNEQAPDYSIDGYIDLLGSMSTDQVIEFVKSLPNGEQIASLPHAKEWTAELQRLINEAGQEGEE